MLSKQLAVYFISAIPLGELTHWLNGWLTGLFCWFDSSHASALAQKSKTATKRSKRDALSFLPTHSRLVKLAERCGNPAGTFYVPWLCFLVVNYGSWLQQQVSLPSTTASRKISLSSSNMISRESRRWYLDQEPRPPLLIQHRTMSRCTHAVELKCDLGSKLLQRQRL